MFSKEAIKLAKPCCEAIKKISRGKWKWKPKRYDLFTDKKAENVYRYGAYADELDMDCVPLLHWEDDLEPILEKFGWDLWGMERTVPSSDGTGSLVVVILTKGKLIKYGRGKDRQEAFQRVVIELVKED